MSRVPVHTVETVPPASRPFVDALLHGPGALGRLLNLQGQLAHAPVVLAAYAGIRKAVEEHATLAFTTRSAIQLTVSAIDDGQYSLAVNMMLARRAGWTDDDIVDIRGGTYGADPKLAALLAVVREGAAHGGRVADATWSAALARGWGDTELAESYVYLALTRFVDEFVAYADTELDVPPEPIRT
ncbi:MAG TPA: carboxymuconolactone decarboxylase family protein [Acidimicrobiia bacterium]|nr:carboxymuconolactone decarboxylase family protein [Acidimicrobiia bacterium]